MFRFGHMAKAHAERIISFLKQIGLDVIEAPVSSQSFLASIEIDNGQLVVDLETLQEPGDLLHEAGHLAVLPSEKRRVANSALLATMPELEVPAIAWSFAAAKHLDLPLEVLFHDRGYKGHSKGLMMTYSLGVYPGLPGLEAAEMAWSKPKADAKGVCAYPAMMKWLRA